MLLIVVLLSKQHIILEAEWIVLLLYLLVKLLQIKGLVGQVGLPQVNASDYIHFGVMKNNFRNLLFLKYKEVTLEM